MKTGIEMARKCAVQTIRNDDENPGIVAFVRIACEKSALAMHAMRQADIDELVECLSQCEDVLAPLVKEPGVNPWLADVRKLLAKHGRDAFPKWADGLIDN